MDLTSYSLEDLILAAIKSEQESHDIYTKIAKNVENGLMIDKFQFLANEEAKHKHYVEQLYHKQFPNKELALPSKTPVPLPEISLPENEEISLSDVIEQAINAEQTAHDFYLHLSARFDDTTTKHMLHYFADMETGHYKLLEQEQQSLKWFEQSDVYWPMVHAGP
jgi:rubrerythrin